MATSTERTYTVAGMTCGHCKIAVTEEVTEVPGVADIDVDVETGRLTVRGKGFDDAGIREAVAEAGYEVVSP
jgi:copper chaperone CopZ